MPHTSNGEVGPEMANPIPVDAFDDCNAIVNWKLYFDCASTGNESPVAFTGVVLVVLTVPNSETDCVSLCVRFCTENVVAVIVVALKYSDVTPLLAVNCVATADVVFIVCAEKPRA